MTQLISKTRPRSRWMVAASAVLMVGVLGGCVTDQGGKQITGSVIGAGLGGLVGSKVGKGSGQLVATATGAVLGGLFGSEIGKSLDRADKAYAQRAQTAATQAPVGETISWSNPESGNRGTVTPTREGRHNRTGAYCREYQTEVIVGGEAQVGYGTACQMPDGDWKIES